MEQKMQATVLVVDDVPENILLLGEILRDEYLVRAATGGQQALAIAFSDNPPDLVLLDVMMPGIDGFEVCRRLKQNDSTKFLPVVVVTSLCAIEHRVQALEAGADDFLSKPVDPSEVRARVRSLVRIKQLHDELLGSYAQLKRLEELRENLTYMIVHDLRTPLASVISGMDMVRLSVDMEPGSEADECQTIAETGARTMLGMINDLLDVNKLEAGEMTICREAVLPCAAIAEVMQSLTPLAQLEKVTVVSECQTTRAVSADAELLRRVLVNVVGNALKFAPTGSTITIGAREGENAVCFWVQDNGPGIPAEYHARIFEKFGQVESYAARKRFSTGLGLAFCKMAVEAHDGRIWLESEAGQGATFYFTLPATSGLSL